MSEKNSINQNMTVLDVVHRFRNTEDVFRSYDQKAGVCVLCEALFETLGDFAARFGIDLNELLNRLEKARLESRRN